MHMPLRLSINLLNLSHQIVQSKQNNHHDKLFNDIKVGYLLVILWIAHLRHLTSSSVHVIFVMRRRLVEKLGPRARSNWRLRIHANVDLLRLLNLGSAVCGLPLALELRLKEYLNLVAHIV